MSDITNNKDNEEINQRSHWRDSSKKRKLDAQSTVNTIISPTQTAQQTNQLHATSIPHIHSCATHQHESSNQDLVQSELCGGDIGHETHFAGLSDSNGEVLPTFLSNYLLQLQSPHINHQIQNLPTDNSIGGTNDINKLAAQALKAKLKRNMKLYDELQAQIELIKSKQFSNKNNNKIVLNELNESNIPYNLKSQTTNNDSMIDMARAEKLSSNTTQYIKQQYHQLLTSRHRNSHTKQQNTDDLFDEYDINKLNDKFDTKVDKQQSASVVKQKQIQSTLRINQTEQSCVYCHIQSYNIVSTGINTVLQSCHKNKIIHNQMTLAVFTHITHRFDIDQATLDELNYTKLCLYNAFRQNHNQSLIFIEQYNSEHPLHYTIEICPVDAIELHDIQLSYKQEIQSLDVQQQNTRNLIELHHTKQTLAQVLHQAYVSYYYVQFGGDTQNSYVHILDPSESYDELFGLRVLCDAIDEPSVLLLRNKSVSRDRAVINVKSIKSIYNDKYDWTHKIK